MFSGALLVIGEPACCRGAIGFLRCSSGARARCHTVHGPVRTWCVLIPLATPHAPVSVRRRPHVKLSCGPIRSHVRMSRVVVAACACPARLLVRTVACRGAGRAQITMAASMTPAQLVDAFLKVYEDKFISSRTELAALYVRCALCERWRVLGGSGALAGSERPPVHAVTNCVLSNPRVGCRRMPHRSRSRARRCAARLASLAPSRSSRSPLVPSAVVSPRTSRARPAPAPTSC